VAREFRLPDLGEGVEAGDVVQVMVAEGDVIRAEQPVIEIETDKAVVEVPCPHAGRVARVHVAKGQKVKVGAVLLTVEDQAPAGGEAPPAPPAVPEPSSAARPAPAPAVSARPASAAASAGAAASATVAAKAVPPPVAPAPPGSPAVAGLSAPLPPVSREVPAGPGTRRLARELGVDLNVLAAEHPGERLTEEHLKAWVKTRLSAAAAPGAGAGAAPAAAPPLPDFSQWGPVERVPMTTLQRKTADHLTTGWTLAPHVTQFDEADVTDLEDLRRKYMAKTGEQAVKLTITAFVLKAVAVTLREHPQFAASLDAAAGEIVYKKYCHIGVAVDTPAGLIVPVVRDVDRKGVVQIASEMNALAERTRQRKVALEELRGGVFTVTNLGGIGGTAFTPVINYPEVAILGLARTRQQPVVRGGAVVPRLILPLCLSYDHRVINGADGARFIRRLSALLESPELLLLEP